jgi:uncharacterized RDD family membrane protein YckC
MADSSIITGQYVRIDQTPASIGARILARFIDLLLIIIYFYAVAMIAAWSQEYDLYIPEDVLITVIVIILLPVFFYTLLWETFNQGQTPGKKLLGIRVVMKDGSVPSLGAYLLRWLMMMVDLYIFPFIGVLAILLTKNHQRVGDLAAGAIVIKEKNYRRINVTLDEFHYLSADYRPSFPQAENLSLEQANLIAQTLFRYDAQRPQRIRELGAKVREFLHINPPIHDEALLQTVVRDFQYYAMEEI